MSYYRRFGGRVTRETIQDEWNGAFIKCLSEARTAAGLVENVPPIDWDKAEKTCTQVITANEKNFGPDSADTIKALEHYAVVLRAAGLRDQAELIEARIAKIRGTKSASDK